MDATAVKLPTLVIGASLKPERASHQAVERLSAAGHPTWALGRREGTIAGVSITTNRDQLAFTELDTCSLYLNPQNQEAFIPWILSLHPRRVIFNPGTENPVFAEQLEQAGILALNACTLVLLSTGQYTLS